MAVEAKPPRNPLAPHQHKKVSSLFATSLRRDAIAMDTIPPERALTILVKQSGQTDLFGGRETEGEHPLSISTISKQLQ
jgi:hypothetical protein